MPSSARKKKKVIESLRIWDSCCIYMAKLRLTRCSISYCCIGLFFFSDTATTEIYTLSLHDALPILAIGRELSRQRVQPEECLLDGHRQFRGQIPRQDRKSTRLNSSHMSISYAVFCLKKKNKYNDLQLNIKKKTYKRT